MNNIEIINNTKTKLNLNKIHQSLNSALIRKINTKKNITFTLHIVSSNKIRFLNNKYRKLNTPTDVLSFPVYSSLDDIKSQKLPQTNIGDIFVCLDVAKKQAKSCHKTLLEEIIFLSEHGLKHLLGFHHK